MDGFFSDISKELLSQLSKEQQVAFAIDCAERVLPIWEEACPDDDRPREAIEAAKTKTHDDTWAYKAGREAIDVSDAVRAAAFAASSVRNTVDNIHCAAEAVEHAAGAGGSVERARQIKDLFQLTNESGEIGQ